MRHLLFSGSEWLQFRKCSFIFELVRNTCKHLRTQLHCVEKCVRPEPESPEEIQCDCPAPAHAYQPIHHKAEKWHYEDWTEWLRFRKAAPVHFRCISVVFEEQAHNPGFGILNGVDILDFCLNGLTIPAVRFIIAGEQRNNWVTNSIFAWDIRDTLFAPEYFQNGLLLYWCKATSGMPIM